MTESQQDIVLSIKGMSKTFGRNRVLDHINLDLRRGSIMGLMGENGAGKSTMMKCLFGTYQKDEGTITLDGREISFSGPKDALENGIAMVHQELNQCLERNVVDNLFLGRYPVNKMGVVDEARMRKEANDLFRRLGMTVNLTQPCAPCRCPSARWSRSPKLSRTTPRSSSLMSPLRRLWRRRWRSSSR